MQLSLPELPTVYLSKWNNFEDNAPRKLCISRDIGARTPRVPLLIPPLHFERLEPKEALDEYTNRLVDRLPELAPGRLYTTAEGGTYVRHTDALFCACGGTRCHLKVVAAILQAAGWNVVFQG